MNMSGSASFLRFVRDWKAEGAGERLGRDPNLWPPGQALVSHQELRLEPHMFTMWGALGRWVGDPAEAFGRVGVQDLP